MNNAPRILVPIALLLVAVVGLVVLLMNSGPEAPPPTNRPARENPAPDEAGPKVAAQERIEEPRNDERTERGVDRSGADHPQGVVGRVLSPRGDPVEGALVYLVKSASADVFETFLAHKQGRVIPPVAQTATGADGRFELGVGKAGATYDLRVVTATHPDHQHKNIRIRERDKYDTGDLVLEPGVVVHGRVTILGTGLAVPGARVFVQSVNEAHSVLPTPGRERGLPATVDQNGFYQLGNASAKTTVNVTADAPGFAQVVVKNVRLEAGTRNEVNLELPRGLPIVGYVFDTQRRPIRSARVVALALSSKTPQTGQAITDNDGRFEIPSLREGPYQLTVTAANYGERVEKPIFSGTQDVTITLETKGLARVKVLSAKGAPILGYKLSLKRHFPGQQVGIGNVPDVPDRRVGPGDHRDGWLEVSGLPNGPHVFQVEAKGHARTLSDPFAIQAGSEAPDVVVHMTLGGAIVGRVLDDQGNPVSGATVRTDMAGMAGAEGGLIDMLKQFMPETVTKATDRTDGNGRFRLPALSYGDYLVKAAHPDFCEGMQQDIKLTGDGAVDIGDIYLRRGAVVHGRASVNGTLTGQVTVQIMPPEGTKPERDAQGRPKAWFTAQAVSRNDGTFRILKRVPPGNYEIYATKATDQGDIFGKLLQRRETKRPLQVVPGQGAIEVNFDISK